MSGVAVFLVKLLDLLDVGEQFLLVQRLADLHGDFFLDLGIAQLFVALNLDFRDARARLHDVGQHHAAVVGLVHRNADVVKLAGGVKRVDVVLGGVGLVDVARP